MNPVLSPKDLALAVGVSESSMKRWADSGRIRAARTAGGHRRIPISEAIRFIRESKTPLVRPDVLGLPDIDAVHPDLVGGTAPGELLYRYLSEGRAHEARGLLMSLYLSGESVAALVDGPVRVAMERIGEIWQHDERGIFFEHRATDICTEAVFQLHAALQPTPGGPVAVGGAPTGDRYILPSLSAATVLAAEGFHAVNLGPHTPIDAVRRAAEHHQARLAWLSISHVENAPALRAEIDALVAEFGPRGIRLVVGGREYGALELAPAAHVFQARTMGELVAYARGVLAGA